MTEADIEEEGYMIEEMISEGWSEDDIIKEILHFRQYIVMTEELQENARLSQEGISEFDTNFVFEPWEIEEYEAYRIYKETEVVPKRKILLLTDAHRSFGPIATMVRIKDD